MAEYEDMMGQMGGMDPLDGPVPGESLTADPATKAPFETAPVHTDVNSAMEDLFLRISEEGVLDGLLNQMRAGIAIEDIAQVILFSGFREGKFNPDMMLLLIEPTIYMLLWFAEYADIEPVLHPDDDLATNFDEEDVEIEEAPVPEGISDDLLSKIKAKKGES